MQNPDAIVTQEFLNSYRFWLHKLAALINLIQYKVFYGFKVLGVENIPPKSKGSYIVVSNHTSSQDPPIVSAALGCKSVSYMAKQELFETWKKRTLYRNLGAFSVNRDKLEMATIRSSLEVLKSGKWHLGIFPEGTRSEDGEVQPLKKGVAFIAKKAKVGVLPIGIARVGEDGREIIVQIGQFIEQNDNMDEMTADVENALKTLKAQAEDYAINRDK